MFGKRIVELREKRGLTQAELAKSIGISRSALSLYEIEKREPDIDTLGKLSALFKVPVGYILGKEQEITDYTNYTMDTPEFALDFKMRIRELLAEQKISEEEFAERAGFNYEEKDSYLYGNQIPSIEDLIKIAGALNVSTDYLLNVTNRKRISAEEEMLLQSFNRCDKECKKYLISKAGVLCVEGISAVAAGEYGKYVDEEKNHFLRVVPEEKGLKKKNGKQA